MLPGCLQWKYMTHGLSHLDFFSLITLLMTRNTNSSFRLYDNANFLSTPFTLNNKSSFLDSCSVFHSKNFTSIIQMLFWSFSNVHLCTDKQCNFPGIFSPPNQSSVFQDKDKGCFLVYLWIQLYSQLREKWKLHRPEYSWTVGNIYILAPHLQVVPKI